MEESRVDLSALDPAWDELRYERLVRGVLSASQQELARRARMQTPLTVVGMWARPMLAAAAVVAILAGGVLFTLERTAPGEASDSLAEGLGIPAPAAEWLTENREPTRADLVLAMESRR
jgi:hypothetical protein